ncbi:MAG: 4a-hydroxytetrahydrobiopterin dehydratase [Gammaproteobacteria bacterium]
MSELSEKRCLPCEGGVQPISPKEAQVYLKQLHHSWKLNAAATQIERNYTFENFYATMAFVNAVAWIAHQENHHPDLEVGYNRCRICYATHAIGGLSENDFICAAKVDRLGNG